MHTRRSYFPPANTIPRHSRRITTNVVESEIRINVTMEDNRTMAQMLQAPIEGYEDAIVVPQINANNFELKQTLINLVQSNQFTERQDPHNHLRFFNKVTSTFRHPEVPNTTIKRSRLFLAFDNSIPPGIENVADDPEGDIHFLEELLIDDESSDSNFEDYPSIPRPPSEPPDAETDAGEEIPVVMNDTDKFDEDYYFFHV
nr:reverse transcriptase domain-containing protein [Tanacetum cinerariifolium]